MQFTKTPKSIPSSPEHPQGVLHQATRHKSKIWLYFQGHARAVQRKWNPN